MQRVAIEVINVSDELAEAAVRKAVDALSVVLKVDHKSLNIEPHDDVRGIWASIDIEPPVDAKSRFAEVVAITTKGLVNTQLYTVSKATIHVTVSTID